MTFSENGDTITGDSSGNILVWGKGKIKQIINMVLHATLKQEDFILGNALNFYIRAFTF